MFQIPLGPTRIQSGTKGPLPVKAACNTTAGVLLAGLAAQGMDLSGRLGGCFRGLRRPALTARGRRSLAGQRVPGVLPGRGDLSGRGELRNDPALGAVLGCPGSRREDCAPLAGKSALNRSGLSAAGADPAKARKIVAGFGRLDRLIADLFVEKRAEPPEGRPGRALLPEKRRPASRNRPQTPPEGGK